MENYLDWAQLYWVVLGSERPRCPLFPWLNPTGFLWPYPPFPGEPGWLCVGLSPRRSLKPKVV